MVQPRQIRETEAEGGHRLWGELAPPEPHPPLQPPPQGSWAALSGAAVGLAAPHPRASGPRQAQPWVSKSLHHHQPTGLCRAAPPGGQGKVCMRVVRCLPQLPPLPKGTPFTHWPRTGRCSRGEPGASPARSLELTALASGKQGRRPQSGCVGTAQGPGLRSRCWDTGGGPIGQTRTLPGQPTLGHTWG